MNRIIAVLLLGVTAMFAKEYKGAELFSTETYKYGKFEARMLMGSGSGVVSSMFLYYNDSWVGGTEPWREVDIEILGKSPESFQSNIITGKASKKTMSEKHHDLPQLANEAYHTFALEWTPDYIAWFVDGVEVRRSTDQQVIDCQEKEQSFRFNLWVANITSWVGAFDPSILPVHQYINWIQYSEYTPEGASDFTLKWRDDFDTFDVRWSFGDWTFAENLVDLDPENAEIVDGYLVLSLTAKGDTGFKGQVPIDQDEASPVLQNQSIIPSKSMNHFSRIVEDVSFKVVEVQLFNVAGVKVNVNDYHQEGTHLQLDMSQELDSGNWILRLLGENKSQDLNIAIP